MSCRSRAEEEARRIINSPGSRNPIDEIGNDFPCSDQIQHLLKNPWKVWKRKSFHEATSPLIDDIR